MRAATDLIAAHGVAGTSTEDEDLNQGFLRWQALLLDGLNAMRDRGELRADADLGELSLVLLTALQGGALLSQTMRNTQPMRASMDSALAYIRSFTPVP
ncbi:TetR family transcriptional regulator C-terminal domain-containing protein [Micromonospora sp. WMMD710]|nr:TetR family transcriptional regulator C-terminal domain-containing protein [Micromonospora sp. WMMD710]MDG4758294.1 TetR family transcriptional regulator C-terminal domain-containing protein [Micromonospora sp. WMMD710]